MSDYTLHGMQDAEKDHDFSVTPRGAMLPDAVYAEYRALDLRKPVPYTPPMQVEISAKPEPLVTLPMKRAAVGFLFVSAIGTGHALVVANGAAIVAIIAPWIGGGFGVLCLGFLLSALGGVVSGSGGGKSAGAKHETHYHYHQYNNQGHGSQNNGV